MQLEALFQPRSIAVIGASAKPTVGRRIVGSLDRIGFTGKIYPVNPSYSAVLGHACYASMAEVPEAPDHAVFCLGHERVLRAFVGAAERGIKGALARRRRTTVAKSARGDSSSPSLGDQILALANGK